ncbi:MAG: tetratricopeptide repeat protein [Myxococcota bacterium]
MESRSARTASSARDPAPSPSSAVLGAGGLAALRRELVWSSLTGQPLPERHFGQYRVLGVLGQGGMGLVLDVYDEVLQRAVALKLLRRRDPGERQRERLLREARILARLSDPHVVHVYEVGTVEGCPFIAMERVRGQTLAAWQRERPRPWRRCVELYLQAGRGLAAAHSQELVHRDFKPDNCIVDREGRVRVLDFGLARAEQGEVSVSVSVSSTTSPGVATRVSGTVQYMAPEQLRGQEARASSDQFAFCVSLFEAICGRRPFAGTTRSSRLRQIERSGSVWPRGSGRARAPRWLRRALRRGLASSPADRFESMEALLAVLERGLGQRARRRVAGVTVTLVLGTAVIMGRGAAPDLCAKVGESSPWSAGRRDAVRDALQSSAADTAWAAIAPGVDAYAAQLRAQRLEACEAHDQGAIGPLAYERRLACFDERQRHLSALLDELLRDPEVSGGHARAGVEALPTVEPCADVERLLRGPGAPPEAIAEEVEEQQREVAAARAAAQLGRQAEGLRRAQQAVDRAQALEWTPLQARALATRGHLLLQGRRFEAAREDLERALVDAEQSGDDPLAFDVLTHLLRLSILVEQSDAARGFVSMAQAKLGRLGDEPLRSIMLERSRGKLALLKGDSRTAVDAFEGVLARLHAMPASPALTLLSAHFDLAHGLEMEGHVDRAEAHYREGLEVAASEPGLESHSDTANLHLSLGDLSFRRGDAEPAQHHYELALQVCAASPAEGDVLTTAAHVGLAQLHLMQGQLDRAEEHARTAYHNARSDPDGLLGDSLQADAHGLLGAIEQAKGEYEAAIGLYARSIELHRSDPQADPTWVAMQHSNIGECRLAQGRAVDAQQHFETALQRLDDRLPPDDPRRAYPLRGLGEARLLQGQPTSAVLPLERALAMRLREPGDRENLASIRWALARALIESPEHSHRHEDALVLARGARDDFMALGDPGQARATEIARRLESLPPSKPTTNTTRKPHDQVLHRE